MWRKATGFVLIAIGFALLCFVAYVYVRQQHELVSPVPNDKGVKVIFVTPGK